MPKPRVHLTRYHGVFAPNSRERASVTPAKRGKFPERKGRDRGNEDKPARRRTSMTWSQRLKRVFGIDIETCAVCGGGVAHHPRKGS